MKKTMFALAAMMMVASMQAVTMNWDKSIALGANAEFSVAVTINAGATTLNSLIGSSPTNGLDNLMTLLTISGTDVSTLQTNVWRNSAGWQVELDKAMRDTGKSTAIGNIPPGAVNSLTLFFSGKVNEDATSMTFSAYYGGHNNHAGATVTWNGDFSGTWDTLTLYPGISNDSADDVTVSVYTDNVYRTPAELALLPEPTVLALLALGVAGIALKRKVA